MKGLVAVLVLAVSIFVFASASLANPVITTQTNVDFTVIDHILITFEKHLKAGSVILFFLGCCYLIFQAGSAAREWAKHWRNGTSKNGGKFVTHDEFNAFKEQNEKEHEQMRVSLNRIDTNLQQIRSSLQHIGKKVDKCFSEISDLKKERE